MADDLKSDIEEAKKDLRKAWEKAAAAVVKKIQNNSTDVVTASDAAAAEVTAAMEKLKALEEAYYQKMGANYGGRRNHKAKGTKRRRHGGFLGLDQLVARLPPWLGGPSPTAAPPPSSAPALTSQRPGIQGGKSGKKRKHSRRKY